MLDPISALSGVGTLTDILTRGGPPAVLAVFVVYLIRVSARNIDKASNDEDRQHYRAVHRSIVRMTYVVTVVVLAFFFMGFFFPTRQPVSGVVTGLTQRETEPVSASDPALLLQSIQPRNPNLHFYRLATYEEDSDRVNLSWIIRPTEVATMIELTFVHHYLLLEDAPGPATPSRRSQPRPVSERIKRDFVVDLRKIGYAWPQDIELQYIPNTVDSVRAVGSLHVRIGAGEWEPLEWSTLAPPAVATRRDGRQPTALLARLSRLLVGAVKAQQLRLSSARLDADRLRRDLASGDLQREARALQMLLENVAAPDDLVMLVEPSRLQSLNAVERGNLIRNTWHAMQDLRGDADAPAVSDSVLSRMGSTLYRLGDYPLAAEAFKGIRDPAQLSDSTRFYRAYVFHVSGLAEDALRAYAAVLDSETDPFVRSAAYDNLAGLRYQRGELPEAESAWRRSLELDAHNDEALNNLAWILQEDPDRLQEALRLVTRALELKPGTPEYLDTRGCLLLRLERTEDAVRAFAAAADIAPGERTIAAHLENARAAGGGRYRCPM